MVTDAGVAAAAVPFNVGKGPLADLAAGDTADGRFVIMWC
jgi:hypothetical protein